MPMSFRKNRKENPKPGKECMIAVLNLFDVIPGKETQYAAYLAAVRPLLERH
jgi:hypothetical protein